MAFISLPYQASLDWFYAKYDVMMVGDSITVNNCDMITLLDRFEDSGFKLVSADNGTVPMFGTKHVLELQRQNSIYTYHWTPLPDGGAAVAYGTIYSLRKPIRKNNQLH